MSVALGPRLAFHTLKFRAYLLSLGCSESLIDQIVAAHRTVEIRNRKKVGPRIYGRSIEIPHDLPDGNVILASEDRRDSWSCRLQTKSKLP